MSKTYRKGILNQNIEEPVEETTQEVVAEVPEVISDERLMTAEEIVAQEEYIEMTGEEELVEEPVVKPQVEMGAPFDEPLKEFHHEFQENYFFGTPSEIADKETVIDVLPKPQRTLESLSRNEYREFQRTGKMPE